MKVLGEGRVTEKLKSMKDRLHNLDHGPIREGTLTYAAIVGETKKVARRLEQDYQKALAEHAATHRALLEQLAIEQEQIAR